MAFFVGNDFTLTATLSLEGRGSKAGIVAGEVNDPLSLVGRGLG